MVRRARVTFLMRDLDRLRCVQGVVDGQLRLYQAAERLGLTTRQVRRMVRRYEQEGPVGLISRHRNRPSNGRLKAEVADQAFAIIRALYADFGPTLACEKLRERHQVTIGRETLRKLMRDAGLWRTRIERRKAIQQPRARRRCFGELIQLDGSEHRWFKDWAAPCTALVYVDDATSRPMTVPFTGAESTFA
jgi:transposase